MKRFYTVACMTHCIDSHDMDSVSLHKIERGKLKAGLKKLLKEEDDSAKFKLDLDGGQYHGDVFISAVNSTSTVVKFFPEDLSAALKELGLPSHPKRK